MKSGLSAFHCVVLTTLMVLGLGVLTYSTWNQSPYANEDGEFPRRPASILRGSALEGKVSLESSFSEGRYMQDIDLGCLEFREVKSIQSYAKRIRLVTKNCGSQSVQDLEIVNRSSGLAATVFNLGNQMYSSDYFDLAKGKNQILISLKGQDGVLVSTHITVHRN